MTELPRVSFFVLAYGQEATVRAAIEGAFAQTYGNLEILLSDDCSPDGTFAIMEEMAANYDGPHEVILNRNPENLGLVAHVNRVMELTTGDFVVQNAGDDISYPQRTERLVEAWQRTGARYVFSAAERIDAAGTKLGIWKHQLDFDGTVDLAEALEDNLLGLGAAAGWSRELFTHFGPLGEGLHVEDVVLGHRAVMLGEVAQIREPLMEWRVGGLSEFNIGRGPDFWFYGWHIKHVRWSLADRLQSARDLGRVDYPDKARCLEVIDRKVDEFRFVLSLVDTNSWGHLKMLPTSWRRARKAGNLEDFKTNLKYLFYWPFKIFFILKHRQWKRPTAPE